MLHKLVHAINYEACIFIHLDKKTDMSVFLSLEWPDSVKFIEDRVAVYWGGISVVNATISLIKSALNSEEPFSHLVLLSGLDYPIKPPRELHKFLNAHQDRQFIHFCKIEQIAPGLRRTENYWFHEPLFSLPIRLEKPFRSFLSKALSFLLPAKQLSHMMLVFGSQWWALTPKCASYIIQLLEENPKLLSFFCTAHAPDEIIFHTIIANSLYIKQSAGFMANAIATRELSNLHGVKIGKVFKEKDFSQLKRTDKFFVRKLDSSSSKKLICLLDKEVLSRQVDMGGAL